jgi:hypothetical protein
MLGVGLEKIKIDFDFLQAGLIQPDLFILVKNALKIRCAQITASDSDQIGEYKGGLKLSLLAMVMIR